MSLRYKKIKNHPSTFLRLFGISPSDFAGIIFKLRPLWEEKVISCYKRPGRNFKLDLEDMVLIILLYYRSYTTQMFVGYLFDLDDSRVCRLIRRIEPLLCKVVAISKTKHLSEKEVGTLIVDATEQSIERPSNCQKTYYSGKKKRHTLKTEIRITKNGRIVHVSKSHPGSVHDFNLHKQEPPLIATGRVLVDSGYQGLQKRYKKTKLPYKASKNNPLTARKKQFNQVLARLRVKVENVFAMMKVFKILSDRYRNKRKRYHLKFNIIAGIVNIKNGFAAA